MLQWALLFGMSALEPGASDELHLEMEVEVAAPVKAVWEAWTTEAGIQSFFAPQCHLKAEINGPFEIFMDANAKPGERGSEGMRFLALEPPFYLAFTWNFPPHMPQLRNQQTMVRLHFYKIGDQKMKLVLRQSGYPNRMPWLEGYAYFERAWRWVLDMLAYRFANGPVDWRNPPKL